MRIQIQIQGTVQGVGFRPFIYRLANELKLNGFVQNSSSGVTIEAEGNKQLLDNFIIRIRNEKPNLSTFTSFDYIYLDSINFEGFSIKESSKSEAVNAIILPDIATCSDCLAEMNNQNDRRYKYPFINCTNCGPRFSIIESLPYDRPNISMKSFQMCPDCLIEYENPNDRRYHAQPIACPVCGPHIELWDSIGNVISKHNMALIDTCDLLLSGKIIALKGIGGFQLLSDSRNTETICQLRTRKHREEKPFAIMVPNIETARLLCEISLLEEELLKSSESPIVLMKRKQTSDFYISNEIAPGNPYLGIMLPYSPIHHLILNHLNIPVIATSGNISDEPMCIDEYEALDRLGSIADYFLINNRPITRCIDDSIVRTISGKKTILRRARGYAPLPINIDHNNLFEEIVLATGAHQKNTIALKKGQNIFVSQHIGDLSTQEASQAFKNIICDFGNLYEAKPDCVISDLHPDYISSKYSKTISINVLNVQHHIAHILSCRVENCVNGKALGIAWDGTGYGLDGSIWGGEFFISDDDSCIHVAQFRQFMLPGGDASIIESRRSIAGMFYEILGNDLFSSQYSELLKNFTKEERNILQNMFTKGINCPLTSSVGRMFDAIASLLDLRQKSSFEGQSAMSVEFEADYQIEESYSFNFFEKKILIIDWEPMLMEVLADIKINVPKSIIAGKYHNFLVEIIIFSAKYFKLNKVILSGGCFQNLILIEKVIKKLESEDYKVYINQLVPTNDGGIALGQIGYYFLQDSYNHIKNVSEVS